MELLGGRTLGSRASWAKAACFISPSAPNSCGAPLRDPTAVKRERLRGLKALIVDDNATNRLVLEEILTSWEMRPATSAGGERAPAPVRAAHEAGDPFSLVLTDANMPDMDGFALAEVLKSDRDLHGAVVIYDQLRRPRRATTSTP